MKMHAKVSQKLTVHFNNIHRRLEMQCKCYVCKLCKQCKRRSLHGFIQWLSVSQNSIVRAVGQAWLVTIKLWDV